MKAITPDNWLEPDLSPNAPVTEARAWRDAFLSIALTPEAPAEIADMFEAARGGMIYGYFFRPLLVLGVEHCYRLLEAGARTRCAMEGLPVSCADSQGKEHPLSFSHNLRTLVSRGIIPEDDLKLWHQARELRNWAAAPEHQSALSAEHGATALERTAELLGSLFRPNKTQ